MCFLFLDFHLKAEIVAKAATTTAIKQEESDREGCINECSGITVTCTGLVKSESNIKTEDLNNFASIKETSSSLIETISHKVIKQEKYVGDIVGDEVILKNEDEDPNDM